MLDLQIVIPTHGRARKQITLMQLPAELRAQTLVVTSTPEDAAVIRDHYDHHNVTVAKGTACIAEKRHWIMCNVTAPHVFMMDDDLHLFTRCPARYRRWADGQWRLGASAPAGVTLLQRVQPADIVACFQLLRAAVQQGHAAVGIAPRMHNDKQHASWCHNTRMMYAFGISREVYLRERLNFAEVLCREDFNITLRLLTRGYTNAVCTEYVADQKYNAAGGASTERSVQHSNAEAEKLAAMYPTLVRVHERAYRGSLPRKEVVVQWKKAAAEAVR